MFGLGSRHLEPPFVQMDTPHHVVELVIPVLQGVVRQHGHAKLQPLQLVRIGEERLNPHLNGIRDSCP